MQEMKDINMREVRNHLNQYGYAVIPNLIPQEKAKKLKSRVEEIMRLERKHPFDQGDGPSLPSDEGYCSEYGPFVADNDEASRVKKRIRADRAREFNTPWPVPPEQVCISFFHLPTIFDQGRSQRVFNLINKELAFAPLVEHPVILELIDSELGKDAVLLDVSINSIGANTDSGGWHVDSPISMVAEPLPNFTLAIQTVWMLDDFTIENGATHVAQGSHLTLKQPPKGKAQLENEVRLTAPAGSLAIWLSQSWHRHGSNSSDEKRVGMIAQYGRAWVKPFVDLRSPMTAEYAEKISPRLRYMMGCNANAPVRG